MLTYFWKLPNPPIQIGENTLAEAPKTHNKPVKKWKRGKALTITQVMFWN